MTSSTGGSKAARNCAGIMMALGIFFIVLAVVNLFLARMIDAAVLLGKHVDQRCEAKA
jgi:hypothetical protein